MGKVNLGIDFDNTIVDYSNLFGKLAKSKNLITTKISQDKESVKNYLIREDKEHIWTKLQGEVYGKEVLKANPYSNFINSISNLDNNCFNKLVISHKTMFPIIGKKYNLHKSAKKWLIKKNFFEEKLGFRKKNIFFEKTFEKKINRIISLKCDIYIDDLKSVLVYLPDSINKILFDPNNKDKKNKNFKIMKNWSELKFLI